jgi:non-specific serine/threonine protein kinase/serine/threonine-protein kinase
LSPEVESLFFEVADLDLEGRRSYLDAHCHDQVVRAEVERLLLFDSGSEKFLRKPVLQLGGELAPDGQAAPPETKRYRIVRLLGRGGMGAVYEVERLDGEVRLRAALKFVPRALRSVRMIERFRQERQILADLNHPNIARLLDAGAAEDGSPYLVMELVEGVPVDQWCAERKLRQREIVELFLPLCAAVQHAHGHLVIHRDLKPGNILVNRAGEAKLLDFGIAKLLDEANRISRTTLRAWTPDYASPEQIEGLPVGVGTDVYGLGCVLHKLLTGSPPKGPVRVQGDLGNILRRALNREPEGRYGSAQELCDELRRYLERRPVRANSGGWSYRVYCFLVRNRWLAAGAAGLALCAGAGSVAAALDARRADRRFEELHRVTSEFLPEFDRQLRNTPGTIRVREFLVSSSLRYLETLERGARGDRRLESEIAAGYRKVGELQFGASAGSLGDVRGAERSFRQSLEILSRAPHGPEFARTVLRLAEVEAATGRVTGSLAHCREAQAIADVRLRTDPEDPAALEAASQASAATAYSLGLLERLDEADTAIRRAVSLDRLAAARRPSADDPAVRLACSLVWLGRLEQARLRREQAEAAQLEALQILRAHPADRPLLVALSRLGALTGDYARRLDYLREAYAIGQRRVGSDGEDSRAQLDLQSVATEYGAALLDAGRLEEAGRLLEFAAGKGVAGPDARSREARLTMAVALGRLADYRLARSDRAAAIAARREAARLERELLVESPEDRSVLVPYMENQAALAQLDAAAAAAICSESPLPLAISESSAQSQLGAAALRLARACDNGKPPVHPDR